MEGRILILLREWWIQETSGLIWWGRIWGDFESKGRATKSKLGRNKDVYWLPTARQDIWQPNAFHSAPLQLEKTFRLQKLNTVSLTPRRLRKQQEWVASDLWLSSMWGGFGIATPSHLSNHWDCSQIHTYLHAKTGKTTMKPLEGSTQKGGSQKLWFQLRSPVVGVQQAWPVRFQPSVLIAKNPSPLSPLSGLTTLVSFRWFQGRCSQVEWALLAKTLSCQLHPVSQTTAGSSLTSPLVPLYYLQDRAPRQRLWLPDLAGPSPGMSS